MTLHFFELISIRRLMNYSPGWSKEHYAHVLRRLAFQFELQMTVLSTYEGIMSPERHSS